MSTVIDRIETRPTNGRAGAGNAPPGARPRGDGCRRGAGPPGIPATDRRGLALSL
jgi:hypothetical protein